MKNQPPSFGKLTFIPCRTPWEDRSISSAEGVQQGDPLGPLLFCLVLHQRGLHLKSDLKVLYLDDVTLGGDCQDLLHDIKDASDLGLSLNARKCEIIGTNMTTCGTLLVSLPGAQLFPPGQATLFVDYRITSWYVSYGA